MSDDADLLGRLAALARRRAQIDNEITVTVAAAREDGATWAAVGAALGVSAQGAHSRYAERRSAALLRRTNTPPTPPKGEPS